ncbi:hypothetical protein [Corynebacterium halotolerans]|uniref:hypothetical protein n=1 Tax=Corynebacterium halotolerans TaxID=225326 RepID=UPI003CEC9E14
MGRHASGKSNYALSTNVIVAIVVVLALIAAATWWFFLRSDGDGTPVAQEQEECSQGELTLPIAEQHPGLAERLISDFAGSDPVVGDHCVTPEVTDDISQAAVYVASTDADADVSAAGRTADGDAALVQVPVGLATTDAAAQPAAEDVTYPVASNEDAAVVAATALAESPEAAAGLLQRDSALTIDDAVADDAPAIAVTEADLPDGYEFTPLDAAAEYQVLSLNSTDEVSAEQVSSADALVAFASENSAQLPENTVSAADAGAVREAFHSGTGVAPEETTTDTEPPAEAAPAEEPADTPEAVVGEPVDTLFLLDTSGQMNSDFGDRSRFEAGAAAISQVAPRLGETGHASSLWNYSSPINPGVMVGYRQNLGFGRGTEVANSVQLLGTAGMPQTREAVTAALQTATDRATEFNIPVKVMVITSGTDDTMSDADFQAVLDNLPANVQLSAFHLGPGEFDPVLNATPVNNYQELEAAVTQSLGL